MEKKKKNYKIIIVSFLITLPFWWVINIVEEDLQDFFFWKNIADHPEIIAASIDLNQKLIDSKPIRRSDALDFQTDARAIFLMFLSDHGQEKILLEKNIDTKLPIASITKLMTANVVLKYYDLNKEIVVSEEAVLQEENFGQLQAGKVFTVKYFLYPLLMESSNDAAFALADDYEGMTESRFVSLMNWEADNIGMENTSFVNVSGLDPKDNEPKSKINISTAKDMSLLIKELLKEDLIWEILSTKEFTEYGPILNNTNKLLENVQGILGGKTGYTEEAKECIILATKSPKNRGILINIIIGSDDRFGEMEKLINWAKSAHEW
ncbi:MAG: serine hydrolase [Candidatus Nealsonbacteria bacterium]